MFLFEPDLFWFISEDQFSYSLMLFLHSPLRYLTTVIKTNIRKTNISYLTKVILSNLTRERVRPGNVFHYLLHVKRSRKRSRTFDGKQNHVSFPNRKNNWTVNKNGVILIRDKVKLEVKIFNFSKSFDYSLKICLGN